MSPHISYTYQYLLGFIYQLPDGLCEQSEGIKANTALQFSETWGFGHIQSFELRLKSVTCPGTFFEPFYSLSITPEKSEMLEVRSFSNTREIWHVKSASKKVSDFISVSNYNKEVLDHPLQFVSV